MLDVVVGSFVTCWMSRFHALGVIMVAPATPGKVHHCSMFSPFVDDRSHCGSLEPQSFRNGFITFSRLIDPIHFLSHLFLNFCDLGMISSFWGSSGVRYFVRQVHLVISWLRTTVKLFFLSFVFWQTLFPHRAMWVWIFPLNNKNLHLKIVFCVYLCYVCVIFKYVWWSETFKCDKHAKKKLHLCQYLKTFFFFFLKFTRIQGFQGILIKISC